MRKHNGTGTLPVDWENLARSTAHPLRISILEVLGMDGGRTLSPNELSQELQIPLSNTNYHVTELAKAGLIELAADVRSAAPPSTSTGSRVTGRTQGGLAPRSISTTIRPRKFDMMISYEPPAVRIPTRRPR